MPIFKKKDDKLDKLLKIVDDATKYNESIFLNKAKRNIRWYEGAYASQYSTDNDKIPYSVNLTYQVARTIRTSIYSKNPQFEVKIGEAVEKKATRTITEQSIEFAIKTYFEFMKINRTNRRVVDDAVIVGFGVSKMGYDYKLDVGDDEAEEQLGSVSADNESQLIKANKPYALRVNPLNILLPPEATNIQDLPYVIERIWLPIAIARELYGDDITVETKTSYYDKPNDKNMQEWALFYEMHDYNDENPRKIIFNKDKIISDVPYPLQEDGNVKSLYQFLSFNDNISDCPYPLSDIDLVAPQIDEANFNFERRVNFNRKNTFKYFVKGTLDKESRKRLMDGEDGAVIENETGDGDLKSVGLMTLGEEFYINIERIRQEIFEILGLTDYEIGGATQKRKATEAQLMERSRLDRVSDRVDIIEEFVFTQADVLIELIKTFQEIRKEMIKEFGEDLVRIPIDSEFLNKLDIQIQVIPGSTVELDGNMMFMNAERALQVAALAPDRIDIDKILRKVFNNLGFPDVVQSSQQPVDLSQLPGNQARPGVPSQTPLQQGRIPNVGSVEAMKQ